MTKIRLEVRTMNAGTAREFQRVFFFCPSGHDLGSTPLDMLDGRTVYATCEHYEHSRKDA